MRSAAGLGKRLARLLGQRLQARKRFRIQPLGLFRDARLAKKEAAVHLAARDARRDHLAQHRLERAQLLGDAELQIQEARVDRAQLEREPAAGRIGRRGGIAGHALNDV